MGRLGYTYGSEWHLLRFLGYHREELNRRIASAIPGSRVLRWSDHGLRKLTNDPPDPGCYPLEPGQPGRQPRPRVLDEELTGISFLDPFTRSRVKKAWNAYWPSSGNVQNWDAVGELEIGGVHHWLLVEAKSHIAELRSRCGAAPHGGLPQILAAFGATIQACHSQVEPNQWLEPYYQFCNRLAAVHFLASHETPVILLNVYFIGDVFPQGDQVVAPAEQVAWHNALTTMYGHVGWDPNDPDNSLSPLVHRLFLTVHGSPL